MRLETGGLIERYVPALGWLRFYEGSRFWRDLSAGLTIAVMLIPQGMAYALLAGLPPVTGLYAATVPLFLYAMFGSSRHLAVGPVAIVSLLTFTSVAAFAEPGTDEYLGLALLLAMMSGAIQIVLGMLRLGVISNFISRPVISGFTSAAAIVIAVSQLHHLLGVELPRDAATFQTLAEAARRFGEMNAATFAIGISSIAALALLGRFAPRVPAALLVVVCPAGKRGSARTWTTPPPGRLFGRSGFSTGAPPTTRTEDGPETRWQR